MLITYLRSSHYTGYEWCQAKHFFSSVLGLPTEPNFKASKGTCTHKALELLARRKLAEQKGQSSFCDIELGCEWPTEFITPNLAIDLAFSYYANPKRTPFNWTEKDKRDCSKWMWDTIKYNNGMFNPLNLNVIQPEQHFDYEINKAWARYDYTLPDGTRLNGHLALKGTVDLVTRDAPGIIHYVDWKTGERKNWGTGKEKSYADLRNDPQMRMYHHALSYLYPGEQIIMTIFFCRSGGPFTLCFDDSDLQKTEDMIQRRFDEIKANVRPKFIYKPGFWKCEKLCEYHKNSWPGTDKSVCQFMAGELQRLGMDKLVAKYADLSNISSYTDGGGQTNRHKK